MQFFKCGDYEQLTMRGREKTIKKKKKVSFCVKQTTRCSPLIFSVYQHCWDLKLKVKKKKHSAVQASKRSVAQVKLQKPNACNQMAKADKIQLKLFITEKLEGIFDLILRILAWKR